MEKFIYLWLIFLLINTSIFAEDSLSETRDLKKIKLELLESFKTFPQQEKIDSVTLMQDLSLKMAEYVKFRTQECTGQMLIVEESEEEGAPLKKKLSPEETKVCKRDLVDLQKKYVDAIYRLRKNNLVNAHKEQLSRLENEYETHKASLEKLK